MGLRRLYSMAKGKHGITIMDYQSGSKLAICDFKLKRKICQNQEIRKRLALMNGNCLRCDTALCQCLLFCVVWGTVHIKSHEMKPSIGN